MHKFLRTPASILLLTRIWQIIAGAVSVVLVLQKLSSTLQGYYYTFLSLTGIQAFFELGLYIVITNFAAHEWVHLQMDENGQVTGTEVHLARLRSLARFSSYWYLIIAFLYFAVALAAGYWLFEGSSKNIFQDWAWPYAVTVFCSSITLCFMPKLSLLEACGQIFHVQIARLVQTGFSNISLWLGLLCGLGLWAVAFSYIISALVIGDFVYRKKHRFFTSLSRSRPVDINISWYHEIWPMQWRLAIQGIVNFFVMSYLVPVTFRFQGSVAAGKIGLSWQIVGALQTLASVWPQVNVPRLGHAAAQRQWKKMKQIWGRNMLISIGSYLFASILLISAMVIFVDIYGSYIERLLEITPMLFLLGAGLVTLLSVNLSVYWRAHKKEPIGIFGVLPGSVAAIALYLAASNGGPDDISIAYFLTLLLVNLPLSFWAWWSVFRG